MRTKWQINTANKAFWRLSTKKRKKAIKKAMKEFEKNVEDRVTPEVLLIKIIGSG